MEKTRVKTAHTVFDIVEALLSVEDPRFSDIVEHLEMPKSTVHDHLQTLESMGYVVREGDRYRVGTEFLRIGANARFKMPLFRQSQDQVRRLAEETGEYVSLSIEENGRGVILFKGEGENAIDIGVHEGIRYPLYATAPGKAMLAHFQEPRLETVRESMELRQITDRTKATWSALTEDLESVREQGYAVDDGEIIEGFKSISAPIISHGTVEGAVTLGGPRNRLDGERFTETLPNKVRQVANIIEVKLS